MSMVLGEGFICSRKMENEWGEEKVLNSGEKNLAVDFTQILVCEVTASKKNKMEIASLQLSIVIYPKK